MRSAGFRFRRTPDLRRTVHCLLVAALCGVAFPVPAQEKPSSATAPHTSLLIVRDLAGATTTIAPAEFAELPRTTVTTKVPHGEETAAYEGVLLGHVLQEAGIQPLAPRQQGQEVSRPLRSAYLLVEGADGYQATFSVHEVFPELGGPHVLLADRINGQPLPEKAAPYQVVVVGSRMHERWVRQVRRILVQPGSASPFPSQPAAAESASKETAPPGVFLVGVGPGDPELITVKAARVLKSADLVLCFSWMKDELGPLVRPGVVEVMSPLLQGGRYCGQNPEQVSPELRDRVAQANEILAQLKTRIKKLVEAGKTVAFADNGDPMIFSPWSWLPEHFAEFPLVVIPGLSSFNAGNAAVQRSVAGLGSVILTSGSELGSPDGNGRLAGTIVFFTQHTKLQEILPRLKARYPADTPAAIVCDVSYPAEKVIHATLGTIQKELADGNLPHLYLFYVGDGMKSSPCCK